MPKRGAVGAPLSKKGYIETIGRFSLRVDGAEMHLRNQKAKAVIAYLALSDHAEESREKLVGMLWSESEPAKARSSLRSCLHEIRGAFHAVGFDGLLTDKLKIGLKPNGLCIDIKELSLSARAGRIPPLLLERDYVLEQLLPGFEDLDAGFASWLFAKRRALHDRLVRSLEEALRDTLLDQRAAEDVARALLRLDPTHEEAARFLIRSKWEVGDSGAAFGIYKKLWDVLEQEYDVEPSPETQNLIAQIRMAQPTNVAVQGFAPQPPATKVLTLSPFASPRGDSARLIVSLGKFDAETIPAENRYLVQEFRRELIANLVRFREWTIRDTLNGETARPPRYDDEVILEGGGYQTGMGIRLVLTLRSAASGAYLWSEKLEVSAEGWWDAQRSIVQRIASALNVHISASRLAVVAEKPEGHLTAHDLWLRGQAIKISFQSDDWHKAAQLFRELISKNPSFAPAYSSLAQLHNSIHVTHYGLRRDEVRRIEALRCARRAVSLDPTDSRSQLCLAWAYLMAHQHDLAAVHFDLACDLNDNDPWTMTSAALGFAFSSDHEHARKIAEHALTLSPTFSGPQWGYQARIRFLRGDYAAAAEAAELAADVPALLPWKAAILSYLEKPDDAQVQIAKFYEVSRGHWCGDGHWSREAAIAWFLTAFPIRMEEDWMRLRNGLQSAGAATKHVNWSDVPWP